MSPTASFNPMRKIWHFAFIILLICMIPGGSALVGKAFGYVGQVLTSGLATLDRKYAERDNAFVHADGSVTAKGLDRARIQLANLRVASAGSMASYDRDLFNHWADSDGNGCSAREDSLLRWGTNVTRTSSCTITGGNWHDPYDNSNYTDPGSLDVDHVVALGEAWRAGASTWSSTKRERFANDPMVLQPVGASLNREKGDRNVTSWLPPNRAFRDDYAVRWINIKARYDLSVTPAEKALLAKLVAPATMGM